MKKHTLLSVATAFATTTVAHAAIVTETVDFDYDPIQGTTELVFAGFDSLGGTRKLTGMTLSYAHNFSLDMFVESTGPTPLASGDFYFSFGLLTVHQLGTVNAGGLRGDGGEGPSGPPFIVSGALYVGDQTGALGAYDGVPGNNGPDSYTTAHAESFVTEFGFGPDEQVFLDAMTDSGPLATVFGGFQEFGFYWANDPGWPVPPSGIPEYPSDAAIWVHLQNFRHFGSITATYEYTNVPTPAAALPLAALGLYVRSRRRS